MPQYTVPASPPPLSTENTYNAWPGGAFPLEKTKGGRRTRTNRRRKNKSKKVTKKTRRH